MPRPDQHHFDRHFLGQCGAVFEACWLVVFAAGSSVYTYEVFVYLFVAVAWRVVEDFNSRRAAGDLRHNNAA